jgi:hypothetical protein
MIATMPTWADFAAAAPALETEGRRLFLRDGHDGAFLVTVRGADGLPRIHPISIGVVDGHLYAFLLGSAKRTDLELDGRYALHAHIDPAVPREFSVRGRARPVDDAAIRSAVATGWWFQPDETHRLFEFLVETALLGERDSPNEWPPRYTSWSSDPA